MKWAEIERHFTESGDWMEKCGCDQVSWAQNARGVISGCSRCMYSKLNEERKNMWEKIVDRCRLFKKRERD